MCREGDGDRGGAGKAGWGGAMYSSVDPGFYIWFGGGGSSKSSVHDIFIVTVTSIAFVKLFMLAFLVFAGLSFFPRTWPIIVKLYGQT